MKGRGGIDLLIGDKVKHCDRQTYDCRDIPEYTGVIVSMDTERLPLIGVDCGVEFIRYIPYMDLAHC